MTSSRHHTDDTMEKKRLLICSRADKASLKMADFLQSNYDFTQSERNEDLFESGNLLLYFIRGLHLNYSNLETEVGSLGIQPADVVFLSKHSSSAGIKSLTVHATGNFGIAELGGLDNHVSMSDPGFMSSSLRIMASEPVEGFNTTFEATHHGPFLMVPNYFIEIGTTENEWGNRSALSVVTRAIVESQASGGDSFVGVGGGHYCPKITEYVLNNGCDVGHIISKHSHNSLTAESLAETVKNTPSCKGFIMDHKGTRGPVRQMVREAVNDASLELIII